jgi:hypothetical protein
MHPASDLQQQTQPQSHHWGVAYQLGSIRRYVMSVHAYVCVQFYGSGCSDPERSAGRCSAWLDTSSRGVTCFGACCPQAALLLHPRCDSEDLILQGNRNCCEQRHSANQGRAFAVKRSCCYRAMMSKVAVISRDPASNSTDSTSVCAAAAKMEPGLVTCCMFCCACDTTSVLLQLRL